MPEEIQEKSSVNNEDLKEKENIVEEENLTTEKMQGKSSIDDLQENEDTVEEESPTTQEMQTEEGEPKSEVELLQEEIANLKDTYARVHADFDNIKKRLEREKYKAVEYSNEKFAKDMIPVLDSLEGAMKSVDSDTDKAELFDKLKEGIELTHKQFLSSLEKHGVTMVSHEDEFDPNIHNAVQSIQSEDVQSGQIVQTFQTGYKYKERPLREAMVIVAK